MSRRTNAREDMGVPRFVEELRLAGQPVITLPRDFGVSIVQARPGGLSLLPPADDFFRSKPEVPLVLPTGQAVVIKLP